MSNCLYYPWLLEKSFYINDTSKLIEILNLSSIVKFLNGLLGLQVQPGKTLTNLRHIKAFARNKMTNRFLSGYFTVRFRVHFLTSSILTKFRLRLRFLSRNCLYLNCGQRALNQVWQRAKAHRNLEANVAQSLWTQNQDVYSQTKKRMKWPKEVAVQI